MSRRVPESHEFVVPPELAEVAERVGVPLHVGDRVRVEVVEGRLSDQLMVPPPRSGEHDDLSSDRFVTVRGMTHADSPDDSMHHWDPRRRAALERLWARFERTGATQKNLGDELLAERRREAAAEDEVVGE